MICLVVKGPSYTEAKKQLHQALSLADLVELRLDTFLSLDFESVKRLRAEFNIPMIFTLRSINHGGAYNGSNEAHLEAIEKLASLEPDYLDVECDLPDAFIQKIHRLYPYLKLIVSYHNFEQTPQDLAGLYHAMQKVSHQYTKIALMAQSTLDAMRLMVWAKKIPSQLLAISMGPYGQISRILAPYLKAPFTYASLDEEPLVGQLSIRTLLDIYHYRRLSPYTTLYGLIGNPVSQSPSDITHNQLLRAFCLDAVYLKMVVAKDELEDFLAYAKELPFAGLSVTIPLKEAIVRFIDTADYEAALIGAVNTLKFSEGKIRGYNTDGLGALEALEPYGRLEKKKVLIIGAGGASSAIAYELHKRGAYVAIASRDDTKAVKLAAKLGCIAYPLEQIAGFTYDILINTTPSTLPSSYILADTIVMDITIRPKKTALLQLAQEKGCQVIYGYKMFIGQALRQFKLWFEDQIEESKARDLLEKALEDF